MKCIVDGQQTIVCKDGSRQRIAGARGKLQLAAGSLQDDLRRGEVPQVDALLNIGIQLASGDVAERKSCASKNAHFANLRRNVRETAYAGCTRAIVGAMSHKNNGLLHL